MCHQNLKKKYVDLDPIWNDVEAISKSAEVREMKYRFTRINRNDSFISAPFLSTIFSISSQRTIITRDQYKPNLFLLQKRNLASKNK